MDQAQKLLSFYRGFDKDQRIVHHKTLDRLMKQFTSTLVLEEPYKLILDSNILMGLEKLDKNPTPEQLAILIFFDFLQFQEHINVSILIRPSVFYEFYNHTDIENEIDHWYKYKNLKKLIEKKLNIRVYSEGLSNYNQCIKNINALKHDIKLIVEKLNDIYSQEWSIDFVRGFGEFDGFPLEGFSRVLTTPHQIAKKLVPKLETKYLNEQAIRYCLANHISYLISTNKSNDKNIIDKYTNKEDFSFRKLVKVVNQDKLKGIADLDLFYLCNIQNQFDYQSFDNYHPSSIPLTIDKDLFKAIGKLSPMVINSYFKGGVAEDSVRMKFDKENEERKRVERANQRLESIYKEEKKYFTKLHKLLEK